LPGLGFQSRHYHSPGSWGVQCWLVGFNNYYKMLSYRRETALQGAL